MAHRFALIAASLALSAAPALADFSYHETTKITGGAMAAMLKVAGVFSKAAREPIESTIALKGNRLAHRGSTHMSLIDLDKRTITSVDFQKKTYSVMTFDEMKKALEDLSAKMKDKKQDAEMNFKVSADATGKTKQIAGYDAKELLIKMQMEATDKKNNQSGSMVVYTDVWMAGGIPGYAEVQAFYKRMAEELNWAPGSNMFMAQPQLAQGFAEAFKEVAKQNGAPVFQMTTMGPEGIAPPTGDPQTAQQQKESKPKVTAGGVLGGALGGRLGGLGRKKSPPPEEEQQQQPNGQQQGGGALLEMQTEYSAFATTVDPSVFDIPSNFKQVEPDMKRMK
jgi:hypothetical protein